MMRWIQPTCIVRRCIAASLRRPLLILAIVWPICGLVVRAQKTILPGWH